jgi:hypothetical protein
VSAFRRAALSVFVTTALLVSDVLRKELDGIAQELTPLVGPVY